MNKHVLKLLIKAFNQNISKSLVKYPQILEKSRTKKEK